MVRTLILDFLPSGADLSPTDRRMARRHIRGASNVLYRTFTRWLIPTIVLWLLIGLASPVFKMPINANVGRVDAITTAAVVAVPFVTWLVFALWCRSWIAPYVRSALSDMGYRLCARCGYIQHAGESTVCSECGASDGAT